MHSIGIKQSLDLQTHKVDSSSNSVHDYQDLALSMSKSVEENQFPSHSPPTSPRTLTAWEKILHQRHIKSLGRPRGIAKANEGGEKELIKHKTHRQQSEKEVGQKSSVYRGVTKYSEIRFEAFVWDNSRSGRGKTVYIGGFKSEIEAARAHDLVAIKIWGKSVYTNFPASYYLKDISEMESMSIKECILAVRRGGKDISKTESHYLGVSRKAESKIWQARLDKGNGMPDLYLGTFDTEEDAARAYDIASIRWMGKEAITNFHLSSYDNLDIIESATLPIEEGIVSSSPKEQTADDVLFQRRDNEVCHPYAKSPEHKSSSSLDEHNYYDQLMDVITSSPFDGHQNHVLTQSNPYVLDGLTGTGTEVSIEGNKNGNYGATFPNQGSTIEQSIFLGSGQESQAPQALPNQSENVNESYENLFDNQFLHQSPSLPLLEDYQDLAFQNDLSFQNDLTFSNWLYDFGSPLEGSTETLGSALNEESLMHNMVNENPGAENGVSSFELQYSTAFHPVDPYNQEFEASNLPILDQSYEPYQYGLNQDPNQNLSSCFPNDFQNPCSEKNTGFQGKKTESQNDLNISQYLNSSYMEENDWTDRVDELWAAMEADITSSSTSNLGFKEDGTQP